MTLSVFLPSSALSRDIFLRVVDEKMIFTDDLACRQYLRRHCTHRQRREKKGSLDRLRRFVYPSRMKRNTRKHVSG